MLCKGYVALCQSYKHLHFLSYPSFSGHILGLVFINCNVLTYTLNYVCVEKSLDIYFIYRLCCTSSKL